MSNDVLELKKSIFYGPQELSPELTPDEFGLRIAAVEARGELGPTVALFATARVAGSLGRRYGGRLPGAARILALEQETGQLYQGVAEPLDATPLIPPTNEANDVAASEDEPELLSIEVQFNVDLADVLRLPPDEGSFLAFVWLDDQVSNVLEFDLPAGGKRPNEPTPPAVELPSLVLRFPGTDAPEVGQAALLLGPPSAESGPTGKHLRVAGRIAAGMFGDEDEAPRLLTVLVRTESEREVQSATVVVPEDFSEEGTFEFDVFALIGSPTPPERVYAIALYGDEVSQTLVIEPTELP